MTPPHGTVVERSELSAVVLDTMSGGIATTVPINEEVADRSKMPTYDATASRMHADAGRSPVAPDAANMDVGGGNEATNIDTGLRRRISRGASEVGDVDVVERDRVGIERATVHPLDVDAVRTGAIDENVAERAAAMMPLTLPPVSIQL